MTVRYYDARDVVVTINGARLDPKRSSVHVRRSFSPVRMTRKRARRTLRQWNRLRRLERVGRAEYPEAMRAIRDVRTGRSISAWEVFRAQCTICPRAWRCM